MTDMGGLSREVTPQGCRESVTFIPALTHGALGGTGQTDILSAFAEDHGRKPVDECHGGPSDLRRP